MTSEQIYRELCRLDPALEPWQKCEHEWGRAVPVAGTMGYSSYCKKCHKDLHSRDRMTPEFGDDCPYTGPRYSTVDALLRLCGGLGVELVKSQVCMFKGESDCKYIVERGNRKTGVGYASSKHIEPEKIAVAALSEAILRAFEVAS